MSLFDIDKSREELIRLENKTMQDGFWNDSKNSNIVLSKIKKLKSKVNYFDTINQELDNICEITEMIIEEFDEDLKKEVLISTKNAEKKLEKLEEENSKNNTTIINKQVDTQDFLNELEF